MRSLVVDAHLDLAVNALQLRRDLTLSAREIRQTEAASERPFGTCVVSLPELRRGGIGIVFATVMIRIDPSGSYVGTGMRTQEQCFGMGRGHAAYYQALEWMGQARILRSREDLDAAVAAWESPAKDEPIGIVLAMESADPIMDPTQVASWYELGLRVVSISHYGVGAYAHGTGTEGGLLPRAPALLRAFQEAGIALDVTHLTDQGLWEALDIFGGVVLASHHNCRELVPGQRQLTDEMIRALVARDAVIGTSFDLWMLDPTFDKERPVRRFGLEAVVDQIDHICQLVGNSNHAAIGSDLDGGYGLEKTPVGLETIADVATVGDLLTSRGYAEQDVRRILSGNWIRLLERIYR